MLYYYNEENRKNFRCKCIFLSHLSGGMLGACLIDISGRLPVLHHMNGVKVNKLLYITAIYV